MSGWTNVTIEPGDSQPEPSANPRDADEQIRTHLEDVYGEDAIFPRDPPTFRAPSRHWGDPDDAYSSTVRHVPTEIEDLATECPTVERILVIYTDDTGDEGIGWLYDVDADDTVEPLEEWAGYSGAMGRDVAGYFEEEHRISGTAQR
jgi:hypothetical protein